MIEIERKFLASSKLLPFVFSHVRGLAPDHSCNGTPGDCYQRIKQGYVLATKYAEIRIREVTFLGGNKDWKLALKLGNGFKRVEIERGIRERVYRWLSHFARFVEKVRIETASKWAVDFFSGSLRGLVLAEYESACVPFVLPEVPVGLRLRRDVTEERTFANKNLAKLRDNGEIDRLFAAEGITRIGNRAVSVRAKGKSDRQQGGF